MRRMGRRTGLVLALVLAGGVDPGVHASEVLEDVAALSQ
jgi:hypothetical protein